MALHRPWRSLMSQYSNPSLCLNLHVKWEPLWEGQSSNGIVSAWRAAAYAFLFPPIVPRGGKYYLSTLYHTFHSPWVDVFDVSVRTACLRAGTISYDSTALPWSRPRWVRTSRRPVNKYRRVNAQDAYEDWGTIVLLQDDNPTTGALRPGHINSKLLAYAQLGPCPRTPHMRHECRLRARAPSSPWGCSCQLVQLETVRLARKGEVSYLLLNPGVLT
ncbi:hypothetical protein C8Q77DRAFT_167268 [Trametes polyzona]|nr:hypothetical protein C8Q77DRAFT_167268 [Trametes polyzona]